MTRIKKKPIEPWMFHLACSIRRTRKELGWSQMKLALEIDCSTFQVSNYESANSVPSVGVLRKLALAFRMSTDRLLGIGGIAFHEKEEES